MTEELAKQIIAEALDFAIKKGCFDLNQVTNIVRSVDYLNSLEPKENENEQKGTPSNED